MKKVKISESLKFGWSLFMKRPWFLLGLVLAMAGLFAVTSSNSAIATALACIIYAGYMTVLLNFSRGNTIVFDDLFSIDNRWISFAFLTIIKGALIILGLMCFIIPGVYLAIRWMFAELYVIDKGMRPIEALKASSNLTKGYRWKLFLFASASVALMIAGLVFIFIGAVIAGIVVGFATIKIYWDLQQYQFEQGNQM